MPANQLGALSTLLNSARSWDRASCPPVATYSGNVLPTMAGGTAAEERAPSEPAAVQLLVHTQQLPCCQAPCGQRQQQSRKWAQSTRQHQQRQHQGANGMSRGCGGPVALQHVLLVVALRWSPCAASHIQRMQRGGQPRS